ncbi:uncharacterized protein E0L32_004744 [Thyridium curvatum]|uniref:Uncharacterized protein n=1 Tax=Thyridium curvatum TaxID=1093900 RepID=A0A507B7S7_9PEZI|nr:uncharacterized protein E0L32_004744 [Thyridium curvatum]TPX15186.1 hypothetical protein E0L32_004744 [Thyridium curvatum]
MENVTLWELLEQLFPVEQTRHTVKWDYTDDLPPRPPKRPKIAAETPGTPYMAVHRQRLSITDSAGIPVSPSSKSIIRKNAQDEISLRLINSRNIVLTSRQAVWSNKLRTSLELPELNSDDTLELLFLLADKSHGFTENPGRFWASVDISLELESDHVKFLLDFELRWNEASRVIPELHKETERNLRHRVLGRFFPNIHSGKIFRNAPHQGTGNSPQDFYEAAFVPTEEEYPVSSLHIPRLVPELYPFQKRAVHWLLEREGVRWSDKELGKQPGLVPLNADRGDIPSHFKKVLDIDNNTFYVSGLYGVVSRDPSLFAAKESSLRGGILSEEMGLGKTVEMISLILLHQRSVESPRIFNNYTDADVRPTGATLIITPPSLKQQWLSELNRHAPHLRVVVYSGIRASCKDEASEAALVEELAQSDVVVTTYNELRNELYFALDPPSRAMRNERKYHRSKSPLMQLSWWRVCLDEAQEIESGVSKTAQLATIIPRVNAWGVTGTPVKEGIKDLWGLLVFLNYEPYASVPKVWQSLITCHKDSFRELFSRLAIRHTKRHVRHELTLPPQKRYVITMPFTAVEEQHYQDLFKQLTADCGLDTEGIPLADDWDPEDPAVLEAMRTALNRLRQTALHPEVGVHNRRALWNKSGPMRTVAEVLGAMIEQSQNAIVIDKRVLITNKLTRGQLLENSPRVREALAIWEGVLPEIDDMVKECREELQKEIEDAKKAGAKIDNNADSEDEPEETFPRRVGEAQRSLRYALELQHKAVFFCANAHFQIKSNEEMTVPESDDFERLEKLETEAYERAKRIRREILQESHGKATRHMEKLSAKANQQDFAVIPELQISSRHGIETGRIVETIEALNGALNEQANILDEWREEVVQLLLKDLVDEDDDVEITGEEYVDSTKVQETLIAYITVLRAVLADRQSALTGLQLSKLSIDEIKGAIYFAKQGEGPVPEKVLELFKIRDAIKPPSDLGSLRSAIVEFRDLSTTLRHPAANGSNRARVELEIATEQMKATQSQLTEQTKAVAGIEQELDRFTSAMNARVEYYRQLQVVSDMVDPYEGPKDDAAMAGLQNEGDTLLQKLTASQSKHRYLLHLKETDSKEEQNMCVICQSSFTMGVLTVCGHQFCKDCITLWFRAHHNCPVCKKKLLASNLHDITLKPQELKVHTETTHTEEAAAQRDSPRTKRSTIYSAFSAEKLAEIKTIDLPGPSFTTKVDTLVRHLQWLRQTDPGAKSIVFSQYPEFLRVLALAFRRHHIGHTAFTDRDGITRFKEDPGIECFLLHARAHSSGLNLVNASHVILCEPLLNTALELQAIARVDRIGQEHETTVWLYIVDGTVEQSIYDLSVRRRLEHMGRNVKGKSKESTPELLDSNLEAANAMEMEEANLAKLMGKGKLSGEEVPKGDLWECLFGSVTRAGSSGEDALRENPEVRRFLAAEAAEGRQAQPEVSD